MSDKAPIPDYILNAPFRMETKELMAYYYGERPPKPKRPRGRPPKEKAASDEQIEKRPRGRPKKVVTAVPHRAEPEIIPEPEPEPEPEMKGESEDTTNSFIKLIQSDPSWLDIELIKFDDFIKDLEELL